MREIRPSGSVRGADREVRPYRDIPDQLRSSRDPGALIQVTGGQPSHLPVAVVVCVGAACYSHSGCLPFGDPFCDVPVDLVTGPSDASATR